MPLASLAKLFDGFGGSVFDGLVVKTINFAKTPGWPFHVLRVPPCYHVDECYSRLVRILG